MKTLWLTTSRWMASEEAFTTEAGFVEDRIGRLEPGKYADLVVLSRNLFEMDPVDIPTVEVELTMVDGEIVFRNEE